MRYAVIRTGGKQYRVAAGQVLEVEKIEAVAGSEVEFADVLMVADDAGVVTVGKPIVTQARVLARVLAQDRDRKIVVYKYKPKKRYRRKTGHRQSITRLAIKEISLTGSV
ncbi:MAG: 50S ribosomal protein L21 [Chloroflexota bacterium]